MKTLLLFIISLILFSNSYTQKSTGFNNTSKMDSLALYHPLQIGNIWQYKLGIVWNRNLVFESTLKIQINKDTLINNHRYFIMDFSYSNGSVNPFDSRIKQKLAYFDTTSGNYYESGSLVDSTLYPVSVKMDNVLNIFTGLRKTWLNGTDYTYAWRIGLIGTYFHMMGSDYTANIIYARINGKEYRTPTFIGKEKEDNIGSYSLLQNYPNPFNPSTTISYSIPKSTFVEITVYDLLGNKIAAPVNEYKTAGNYSIQFNASNLSNGLYFYKMKTDEVLITKKMLLLK